MHHDESFASFIFEDMRYALYPEVIEFYTGIDRRREDALRILINDLRIASDKVKDRLGFPEELNPYKFARWRPSVPMLEQMHKELTSGVLASNLPASIKDRYADRTYDRSRPYYQDIRAILSEYSFIYMMRTMRAGAKALRNSDYVDPDIRRQLLQEIMTCWEQASKVLFVLVPLLTVNGNAKFEGALFVLDDNFSKELEVRFNEILFQIPQNVVSWCEDDLFSQKLGPLLIDQLVREDAPIKKHELMLLLIKQRPRGWKTQVQQYIASAHENSFYLMDVYKFLRSQYRYSYASPNSLRDMQYLIKMAVAKHETGKKMPGVKLIGKVSDKVIPPRNVDQDG
jgi:hypothetical protein